MIKMMKMQKNTEKSNREEKENIFKKEVLYLVLVVLTMLMSL